MFSFDDRDGRTEISETHSKICAFAAQFDHFTFEPHLVHSTSRNLLPKVDVFADSASIALLDRASGSPTSAPD